MRVISGTARGAKLSSLEGSETRPTADRVKEGMFSALQFILPGAKVLDLYAGSGQLGIEALSRGAKSCVFIDDARDASAIIQKNLRAASLFDKASVAATEAVGYVRACRESFDIIILDPPYRNNTVNLLLPLLDEILADGGVIMCETERSAELPDQCNGLTKAKQYRYGTMLVTRYTKQEDEL